MRNGPLWADSEFSTLRHLLWQWRVGRDSKKLEVAPKVAAEVERLLAAGKPVSEVVLVVLELASGS